MLAVCNICHTKLSQEPSKSIIDSSHEMPKNFLKLVDENKKLKETTYDDHLAQRLAQISTKDLKKEPLSDDKLRERLNRLMGVDNQVKTSTVLPEVKPLTVDDLMKQAKEEADIDHNLRSINDSEVQKLEERLKKLQEGAPVNTKSKILNEALEDTGNTTKSVNDLIREILNENDVVESDSEIDNWCCICNNDGALKCIDCDNDVYCRRCFKECHDSYDLKTHKIIKL